jgi:hypothetical protein
MKAFYFWTVYDDDEGERVGWPRLIVFGDRSAILADRMIEYAESIPVSACKPEPRAIGTELFDPEAWLATDLPGEVFVAISGELDSQEESLLERIVARVGADCFVVIDAQTERRSNWRSVVQLPPHRSWDAQWAWGIRAFLDLLLEAVVHRGLICFDPMDILTGLSGRLCQIAVCRAEGERRSGVATVKAIRSLSKRLDLGNADVLLLTFYTGEDFQPKEIQQAQAALRNAVDWDNTTTIITHVFTNENRSDRFAVSLIAATPLV